MGLLSDLMPGAAALGSVASSFIEGQVARQNTDKTIAANKQLAEYQYSKDVEMWNKANQYNLPVNQMARFKAAGLNPNLIYGQGNPGNTATSLPKYQAPTVQYGYKPRIDPLSALAAYQDMTVKTAHVDNVKAESNNKDADTAMKLAQAKWYEDRNRWMIGNELGYWNNKMVQETNRTQAGVYNRMLAKYNMEYRQKQYDNFDKVLSATLDNMRSNISYRNYLSQGQSISNQFASSRNLVDLITKVLMGGGSFARSVK